LRNSLGTMRAPRVLSNATQGMLSLPTRRADKCAVGPDQGRTRGDFVRGHWAPIGRDDAPVLAWVYQSEPVVAELGWNSSPSIHDFSCETSFAHVVTVLPFLST
jgi:hypothetical protein